MWKLTIKQKGKGDHGYITDSIEVTHEDLRIVTLLVENISNFGSEYEMEFDIEKVADNDEEKGEEA